MFLDNTRSADHVVSGFPCSSYVVDIYNKAVDSNDFRLILIHAIVVLEPFVYRLLTLFARHRRPCVYANILTQYFAIALVSI